MDATEAWKAQRTAQALDGLVQQQRMSQRLAALELALTYEVEAHRAAKARITQLESQLITLKAGPADAVECEMRGVPVWVTYSLFDGDITVERITVEHGCDISDLLSGKDVWILGTQIMDKLDAEESEG